jgi:hypothetical protein
MKGYGRTVMAGTKIVTFEAEIVSVMSNWGPHQDVILAKLGGLDLEKTGIIAGMSGSPVYVRDPADGKDKMIGAVAYGWSAPKEPLCGIQPITQMLAVSGVLDNTLGQHPADDQAAGAAASETPSGAKPATREYLDRVLNPGKIDFIGSLPAKEHGKSATSLLPLTTPLMASGLAPGILDRANDLLRPRGILMVQSGGVGLTDPAEVRGVKLEPGGGIAIPVVSGDADLCAVGTVTEVIGDRLLAFGHSFFSQGDLEMPIAPAYVHTVVSGLVESFKLASTVPPDPAHPGSVAFGALHRDEAVGIAGRIGSKVATIPMTVKVDWKDRSETRQFHYHIIRHPYFTPILVYMMVNNACTGWYDFPKEHTLRYDVEVDFGKLGKFQAHNTSANSETRDLCSDLVRPIMAMKDNPWSKPPEVQSINVHVTVEPGARAAEILELKLDGHVYRPGETVTGSVLIDPYRQTRQSLPVSFALPADLPVGNYQLTACDAVDSLRSFQNEMPQRFDPHSTGELMEAMRLIAQPSATAFYLRLQLPEGGLSLKTKELPDLPPSKLHVLSQNEKREMYSFTDSLVRAVEGHYVLGGSAGASFEVTTKPRQVFVRDQRNP